MKKGRLWIALGVLIVAAGSLFYFFAKPDAPSPAGGRRGTDGAGRPTPVMAIAAKSGDIDVVIDALGTVTARSTVTVKPRVDGQLVSVAGHEGQLVKAGELLAEIDPRPFQVVLDQANGQLLRDQALYDNAKLDYERYRGLLAKDSIARQQVDAQEALVRQTLGTVQTDSAQVDNAKLQFSFTRVTAPVSGRLGLRLVDTGNMVHASDATGLFVITQTQPITVIFAIPADNLSAVLKRFQAGTSLPVEAFDREGKKLLATGRLLTVDNQMDVTTGTVKLKAEFSNIDNALFPNQFVNARLRVDTRHAATLIPLAAIQRGTQGTFSYVVNQDQTVSVRLITLGPTSGDVVAVEKGLMPGEQVVIDGADKLRQGAKVEVMTAAAREGLRKGPPGGKSGNAAGPGATRREGGERRGGSEPKGEPNKAPPGPPAEEKAAARRDGA